MLTKCRRSFGGSLKAAMYLASHHRQKAAAMHMLCRGNNSVHLPASLLPAGIAGLSQGHITHAPAAAFWRLMEQLNHTTAGKKARRHGRTA